MVAGRRIYIVRNHIRPTASEDELRRLSVCSGDSLRVQVSGSVTIICSYEL
jgi:hypothetical protein